MGKRESGVGGTSPSPNAVVLRPGQELPPCLETVLVVTTERGCVSVCATENLLGRRQRCCQSPYL